MVKWKEVEDALEWEDGGKIAKKMASRIIRKVGWEEAKPFFPKQVAGRPYSQQDAIKDMTIEIRGCAMDEKNPSGFANCLMEQELGGEIYSTYTPALKEVLEETSEIKEEVVQEKRAKAEMEEAMEERKSKASKEVSELFK